MLANIFKRIPKRPENLMGAGLEWCGHMDPFATMEPLVVEIGRCLGRRAGRSPVSRGAVVWQTTPSVQFRGNMRVARILSLPSGEGPMPSKSPRKSGGAGEEDTSGRDSVFLPGYFFPSNFWGSKQHTWAGVSFFDNDDVMAKVTEALRRSPADDESWLADSYIEGVEEPRPHPHQEALEGIQNRHRQSRLDMPDPSNVFFCLLGLAKQLEAFRADSLAGGNAERDGLAHLKYYRFQDVSRGYYPALLAAGGLKKAMTKMNELNKSIGWKDWVDLRGLPAPRAKTDKGNNALGVAWARLGPAWQNKLRKVELFHEGEGETAVDVFGVQVGGENYKDLQLAIVRVYHEKMGIADSSRGTVLLRGGLLSLASAILALEGIVTPEYLELLVQLKNRNQDHMWEYWKALKVGESDAMKARESEWRSWHFRALGGVALPRGSLKVEEQH